MTVYSTALSIQFATSDRNLSVLLLPCSQVNPASQGKLKEKLGYWLKHNSYVKYQLVSKIWNCIISLMSTKEEWIKTQN